MLSKASLGTPLGGVVARVERLSETLVGSWQLGQFTLAVDLLNEILPNRKGTHRHHHIGP